MFWLKISLVFVIFVLFYPNFLSALLLFRQSISVFGMFLEFPFILLLRGNLTGLGKSVYFSLFSFFFLPFLYLCIMLTFVISVDFQTSMAWIKLQKLLRGKIIVKNSIFIYGFGFFLGWDYCCMHLGFSAFDWGVLVLNCIFDFIRF